MKQLMMKHFRPILTALFAFLVLFFAAIGILYYQYANPSLPQDQPPYFNLFIAELFNLNDSAASPWDSVGLDQTRPVEWNIDIASLEKLDSFSVSLTNLSDEQFYYMSWGTPFSRVRVNYTVYREGQREHIPFDGFGCGTGIHFIPIDKGETIQNHFAPSLLTFSLYYHEASIASDSFPLLYRQTYGDSVAIQFAQATHSNPWGHYPSQMIYSPKVMVVTDRVLDNWCGKHQTK